MYVKLEVSFYFVFMLEVLWNIRVKREKLIELMFEYYNIFVFFFCKIVVLIVFVNGCFIGLILDSGVIYIIVILVYDGYVF